MRTEPTAAAGRRALALPGLAATCLLVLACARGSSESPGADRPDRPPAGMPGIEVTSPAFAEGAPIPRRHTCQGEGLSPPLAWSGVPAAARSIALICEDPDAPLGTWVHWVLYDVPPTARGLPEGVPVAEVLPDSSRQARSSFRRPGYGGPCPPPGRPHRYFFKVYALDVRLGEERPADKAALERAMRGHVLARGQLMGTYRR